MKAHDQPRVKGPAPRSRILCRALLSVVRLLGFFMSFYYLDET